jgi:tRNA threonylcarbamoyladenosine biosynthesis protein TsaE
MQLILEKQSLEDTEKLAEKLAGFLSIGDILLLDGELGAGKTTFTRSLVAALGGKNIRVSSPTFTIMQEYKSDDMKLPIYHFDAYRLEGIGGEDQGFEDYIYGDGVSVIEWSEYLKDILPNENLRLIFKRDDQNPEELRTITLESNLEKFSELLEGH